MEKYTNWRDKGTGIAPFLPPSVASPTVASRVAQILTLLVKCILTLPLIIACAISKSRQLYRWVLLVVFAWKMDVTVQGVKKRDLKVSLHYPQKNRLYVCNCSSPLDALALHLIAQGPSQFLIPFENVIYKMDKDQYMNFVLDGSLNVRRFGQEVHNFGQLKDSVVFMFPEGTCSNGKSILPFEIDSATLKDFLEPRAANSSTSGPVVQTIHLKINGTLVAPLAISKSKYLMRMISKGVNIKIRIAEAQPIFPIDALRISLNDGDKFKLVSKTLNIESKRKFVQEFTRTS